MSYQGLKGTVAYSKVSDDQTTSTGALIAGIGNNADFLYTDPVFAANGYYRDTASYMVDVNYDITPFTNIGARYVLADGYINSSVNRKVSSTSFYGSYKFDGALKGLNLVLQYEIQGKDDDASDVRAKVIYKF